MAFSSTIKGLWLFSNTLEDEISNNNFTNLDGIGEEYSTYQQFDLLSNSFSSQSGLTFNSDESGYMSNNDDTRFSDSSFAISFRWFSPGPVGFIRHALTRQTTPRITPIFAKAESSISNTTQTVNIGEIIISEIGISSTQNAIKVDICSRNTFPTHSFISDPYDPGLHHVYVEYTTGSSATYIRIFIDGEAGATLVGPADSVNNTSASVYLNRISHGPISHNFTQDGSFISQLVIQNTTTNAARDARRSFRFGHGSITDSVRVNVNYDFWGTSYKQPSTTTTNQIYSAGGDIYLARSNGDLLRGSQPIWDTEFNFLTEENIDLLNTNDKLNISRSPTGLRIDGTTVRI